MMSFRPVSGREHPGPCFREEQAMLRSAKVQMVAVLAAGALLGYAAASGRLSPFLPAGAAPPPDGKTTAGPSEPGKGEPDTCCDALNKGQLLAKADAKGGGADAKKPNIVV